MSNDFDISLKACLRSFPNINLLIIADEYPPQTIGGAEISLHETIRGLGDGISCLVVKFTSDSNKISHYRHENINVIRLPRSSVWPERQVLSKNILKRAWGRTIRVFRDWQRAARFVMQYGLPRERRAVYRLSWRPGIGPSGGVLLDSMPEQYDDYSKWLNIIMRGLKPEIVLANNTRSIMTFYHAKTRDEQAWEGARTIGFVRDNRFNCPRHNQIMRIGDNDCVVCDFSCAGEDARKGQVEAQRLLLESTRAVRIKALNLFDDIVVTSLFLKRAIREIVEEQAQIHLVPNFAGDEVEIDGFTRLTGEKPTNIIVIIGSLNEAKGQLAFLMNSVNQIKEYENLEIHIMGKGDRIKRAIVSLVKKEKIPEGKIRFRGFLQRERLYGVIAEAKLVILPTIWPEPFGRVPLEAALCRKTVVAFNTGGLAETIKDGETGFLVEKEDYGAMWRKIDDLLEDGKKRMKVGEAARTHIVENYSKEITLASLAHLIKIDQYSHENQPVVEVAE